MSNKMIKPTKKKTSPPPKIPESVSKADMSLLAKLMRPKTQDQVHSTISVAMIFATLLAGLAYDFSVNSDRELIKKERVRSTPEVTEAITKLVEEECRNKPGSSPSIYSGQDTKAVLEAACTRASKQPPLIDGSTNAAPLNATKPE